MKKVTLTGKLNLNKETISKLNDAQMGVVKGGVVEAKPLTLFASRCHQCGTCVSCASGCLSIFNCDAAA